MLILPIVICSWIALLALVTALCVAAARADDDLAVAAGEHGAEPAHAIVLLDWSGAPLLAAVADEPARVPRAAVPA